MLAIPARVIATSFALACFAATIAVGMYNGNDWVSILSSALFVCLFAWLIGSLLGALILRCINEQIQQHVEENPIPDESEIYAADPVQPGAG